MLCCFALIKGVLVGRDCGRIRFLVNETQNKHVQAMEHRKCHFLKISFS